MYIFYVTAWRDTHNKINTIRHGNNSIEMIDTKYEFLLASFCILVIIGNISLGMNFTLLSNMLDFSHDINNTFFSPHENTMPSLELD